MTAPVTFDAARTQNGLTSRQAVEALRAALADGLDPEAEPPRHSVAFGSGELLVMPATGGPVAGVKLVTVVPDDPKRAGPRIAGTYLLFEADSLRPLATLDGAALTALRTPAVSALGVDLVAPPDAHRLVIFGSGPQAAGHARALRAVRPVDSITVVGRDAGRADRLVRNLRADGLDAVTGGPEAVGDADLIACCTTARGPLFDGHLLGERAVVVAVGSHEPTAREVDAETVRRCGVLVESRTAALREAGDVLLAIEEGALTPDDLVTFADVVNERSAARPRLVKTVGMGWQDLVIAAALVRGAPVPAAAR